MDMSLEAAAAELLRMASGDRGRIEQAIARIDRGCPGPPGPVREYASDALRLAWEWSLHPSVPVGPPG
jgi:hypothetical protein